MAKLLLGLVAGALAGAVAARVAGRSGRAAEAIPASVADPGPDRVAVDVSAFTD